MLGAGHSLTHPTPLSRISMQAQTIALQQSEVTRLRAVISRLPAGGG